VRAIDLTRTDPLPKHMKKVAPKLSPWRRISVDCRADAADAIGGILLHEGALGLETEDDETRAVPGRALAPTGRALITGTFSRELGLEARVVKSLTRLATHVPEAKDLDVTWSDLFAEDWNAVFRAHWKPFRCGTRVWVCPSWERESFRAERVFEGAEPITLYLDAGMAFGTGTHETTQLCIEAVEQLGAPPRKLLDVGTGTGILCLAAIKLGCTDAKGTDIDPVAVSAALEHARDNGCEKFFRANDDMPNANGPVYDVVLANILAGTLIEMVEPITGALARGGKLFLSGVLVDQEPAVREAYLKRGLMHRGTATKNGWVRIDLEKP
jgi:ribosomal protein L11 methyltransferase